MSRRAQTGRLYVGCRIEQQRQETVSITPQLDLERYRGRVSLHFRLSLRAHRAVQVRCRCRCLCRCRYTCTRMNVSWRGENAFVIVLPVEARWGGTVRLSTTAIPRTEPQLQACHNRTRSSVVFQNGELLAPFRTRSTGSTLQGTLLSVLDDRG